VWVELDSREHHGTLLDWHDDLRRENGLKLVGWPDPLRFSGADLRFRPDEVIDCVSEALAQARARLRIDG
jgi:very-short-patch-repair endonuclease